METEDLRQSYVLYRSLLQSKELISSEELWLLVLETWHRLKNVRQI